MKKLICLLLALVMVFALVACGTKDTEEKPDMETIPTDATEAPAESEEPTENEQLAVESPMTEFYLSYADNEGNKSLIAYSNGDGTAYVDFSRAERKTGNVEAAMEQIAAELFKTALPSLNGQSEYGEGDAFAYFSASFEDGTNYHVDFSGVIPQEFLDGMAAMEACFEAVTAELPVYVPELVINEGVNPDALAAMQEIMNGTGFSDLDQYAVGDVALDEYFGDTVGLSGTTGIANATQCSAMMITTPYSLVIVSVEDAANIDAVRADFAANINWQKFVCVTPSDALIAQKGNMVLFLMGSDALFESTKTAIENAGWENIEGFTNPDM